MAKRKPFEDVGSLISLASAENDWVCIGSKEIGHMNTDCTSIDSSSLIVFFRSNFSEPAAEINPPQALPSKMPSVTAVSRSRTWPPLPTLASYLVELQGCDYASGVAPIVYRKKEKNAIHNSR